MSDIVGDEACPRCRERGHDKTGNHLMVFSDGGKYCNRCRYAVHPDGQPTVLTGNETVAEVERYAPYNGEPIRGIKNSVRSLYGDKVGVDTSTGEAVKVYYPKGNGYKIRTLKSKGFYSVGSTGGDVPLYGMHTQNNPTLLITGGEEDAKAAYQMLHAAMPHNTPHCVSLPNGESDYASISNNMEWIMKHKKIILCLDMDAAGIKGTNNIASLLNIPVHVVEMEHKDPNDCLVEGGEAEFVSAVVNAKTHSPGGITHIRDVMEEALERVEWGVPFPWDSLTAKTYGMRPGDGYYIGAGVKCGKSEWLNELAIHLVKSGHTPFLIKGEEVVKLTARKLAGKLAGKIYHRPDIEVDEVEAREMLEKLDKNIILYDRDNDLDWESIKAAIRHAVIVEGSKFIFLDPIVCLTDGMEASEANTFLQKFSREIDQMAKDLGFTYFVFTHLNAPRTGQPHERGGKVQSLQFTGSRSMMRATTYMIGIERNKDPELDEVEQNTSYFVLLEDRNNGNTCRFPVYYDKDTGSYLEPRNGF